ncbi:hypothetical protein Nepgr_016110 [Nepenthes gracilis]|uniref:Uncharacterized protein n=1 Tax=Nepenthes gracilis TaxID=150966 RepID=A0AAD3SP59_NEPGR|nr:hypothetical protein Nepgr_016110 [Nepenthes gracilis]
MDLMSPILEVASKLCDCVANRAAYINDLEETIGSLERARDELKGLSEDVQLKVGQAKRKHMKPKSQVIDWLTKAEAAEKEAAEILQRGSLEIQKKCLGNCCPKNCWSSYKLGKRATKALKTVIEIRSKGDFDEVAHEYVNSAENRAEGLYEMPMEKDIGLDSTFENVWECLEDKQVGIIGLYGMGGVGKTTLMKRINNELLKYPRDFNLVIWVVASKSARMDMIQEEILTKTQVPSKLWKDKNEQEKAILVLNFLKQRKFILMLDDLWERLDLSQMGIPLQNTQNGCKVVFTTRSKEVCGQMGAHESIRVRCLKWDEAWSLFQEKLGKDTLSSHPDIPRLAQIVARECDGLPLALLTIGRAMASRKNPCEWEHAIQVLMTYPSKFSGMGDQVLHVLKFSYDSILNEIIKQCFLYCALFPEDYEMVNEDLVYLWIAEGYLNEFRDIREARNYGLYIIETLKLACLLEDGESRGKIKMHDVIRDMAIWIACEYGMKKNKFWIQERSRSTGEDDVEEWKQVERIAFWGNMIRELPHSPHFSRLSTCFIRQSDLRIFHLGFFRFMKVIKVLDLSDNTKLEYLPKSISNLVTLEYLNLSNTGIKNLPIELKSLTKLRYLLMDFMLCLEEIPIELISSFSHLQVFRMNYSRVNEVAALEALLEHLAQLKHMNEIGIYLCSTKSIRTFMCSDKLQGCIRHLRVENSSSPSKFKLSRMTTNLETLHIYHCSVEELEVESKIMPQQPNPKSRSKQPILNLPFTRADYLHRLTCVSIYRCANLVNLNFLIHAPSIQMLWVSLCPSLKVIIGRVEGGDSSTFSNLRKLRLDNLPKLYSIYPGALPFPSLEAVYLIECPSLKVLPFDHGITQTFPVRSPYQQNFRLVVKKNGDRIGRYWPEDIELFLTRTVLGHAEYEEDFPTLEEPQQFVWDDKHTIPEERLGLVRASMNM